MSLLYLRHLSLFPAITVQDSNASYPWLPLTRTLFLLLNPLPMGTSAVRYHTPSLLGLYDSVYFAFSSEGSMLWREFLFFPFAFFFPFSIKLSSDFELVLLFPFPFPLFSFFLFFAFFFGCHHGNCGALASSNLKPVSKFVKSIMGFPVPV